MILDVSKFKITDAGGEKPAIIEDLNTLFANAVCFGAKDISLFDKMREVYYGNTVEISKNQLAEIIITINSMNHIMSPFLAIQIVKQLKETYDNEEIVQTI